MHKFPYKLTFLNFLTCASLHMIEKPYIYIYIYMGSVGLCKILVETIMVRQIKSALFLWGAYLRG
jgi:hypothetical protein